MTDRLAAELNFNLLSVRDLLPSHTLDTIAAVLSDSGTDSADSNGAQHTKSTRLIVVARPLARSPSALADFEIVSFIRPEIATTFANE